MLLSGGRGPEFAFYCHIVYKAGPTRNLRRDWSRPDNRRRPILSLRKVYNETLQHPVHPSVGTGSSNANAHIAAEVIRAAMQAIRNDGDFSVMLDRVCTDKGFVLKITPSGNRSYSEVSVTVEEALAACQVQRGHLPSTADDLAVTIVKKLALAQAETRRNLALQGMALRS